MPPEPQPEPTAEEPAGVEENIRVTPQPEEIPSKEEIEEERSMPVAEVIQPVIKKPSRPKRSHKKTVMPPKNCRRDGISCSTGIISTQKSGACGRRYDRIDPNFDCGNSPAADGFSLLYLTR
jgi:hypothetical protein